MVPLVQSPLCPLWLKNEDITLCALVVNKKEDITHGAPCAIPFVSLVVKKYQPQATKLDTTQSRPPVITTGFPKATTTTQDQKVAQHAIA